MSDHFFFIMCIGILGVISVLFVLLVEYLQVVVKETYAYGGHGFSRLGTLNVVGRSHEDGTWIHLHEIDNPIVSEKITDEYPRICEIHTKYKTERDWIEQALTLAISEQTLNFSTNKWQDIGIKYHINFCHPKLFWVNGRWQ